MELKIETRYRLLFVCVQFEMLYVLSGPTGLTIVALLDHKTVRQCVIVCECTAYRFYWATPLPRFSDTADHQPLPCYIVLQLGPHWVRIYWLNGLETSVDAGGWLLEPLAIFSEPSAPSVAWDGKKVYQYDHETILVFKIEKKKEANMPHHYGI